MARTRSRSSATHSASNHPDSTLGDMPDPSGQGSRKGRKKSSRSLDFESEDSRLSVAPQHPPNTKRKLDSASPSGTSKRPRTEGPARRNQQEEVEESEEDEGEDEPMNPTLVDALNISAGGSKSISHKPPPRGRPANSSRTYQSPAKKGPGRPKRSSRKVLRVRRVSARLLPVQEEDEDQDEGDDDEHQEIEESDGDKQDNDSLREGRDEDDDNQRQAREGTARSDSLFVTQPQSLSPDLGLEQARLQPRSDVYDVPVNERRPQYDLSSSLPPPRRTINGLSAESSKPSSSRRGRKLVPKAPSNVNDLNMDDSGFGYAPQTQRPATAKQTAQPTRTRQHSSSPSQHDAMETVRDELAKLRQEWNVDAPEGEDGAENELEVDDEVEDDDEDEEGGAKIRPAPSEKDQKFTIEASTTAIRTLQSIMARPAFVGKRHWYKHLHQNGDDDTPLGLHPLGKSCIRVLNDFTGQFRMAPKAPDLDRQRLWFGQHGEKLIKGAALLRTSLKNISMKLLSGVDDRRRGLMADVLGHVIPILVRLLWTIGCLGGVEENDQGIVDISGKGVYNILTVSYLRSVTGWLRRLNQAVQTGNNISRVRNPDEESKRKKNRRDFGTALNHWREELADAEEELDQRINHSNHIRQVSQRDTIIQSQKVKESEDACRVSDLGYARFAESAVRATTKPGPMDEKRRMMREFQSTFTQPQTQPAPPVPKQPVAQPHVRQQPARQQPVGRQRPSGPRPQTPQPPEHPLSEEHRKWLLKELATRRNPPTDHDVAEWAGVLEVDDDEVTDQVVFEIERAQFLAWQQGTAPKPWAQLLEEN
ncbi:hypothetical protein OQA88_10042 [Cercophora sp. LCS_1]